MTRVICFAALCCLIIGGTCPAILAEVIVEASATIVPSSVKAHTSTSAMKAHTSSSAMKAHTSLKSHIPSSHVSSHHSTPMLHSSSLASINTTHSSVHLSSTPHPTSSHYNFSVSTLMASIGNASSYSPTVSAFMSSIQNASVYSPTASVHNMSSMVHNTSSASVYPTSTIHPSVVTSVVPSSSPVPTTMPPTTMPPQPQGRFHVSTKNGSDCLLLWMSLRLTIAYKNSSGDMRTTMAQMPVDGDVQGSCGDDLSYIEVLWPKKKPLYSAKIWFTTTGKELTQESTSDWMTENITVTANTTNNAAFIAANASFLEETVQQGSSLEFLSGMLGHSLNCSQPQNVHIGDTFRAEFSNVRVQPFEVNKGFDSHVDTCEISPVPPTVKPTPKPSKGKADSHTVAIAVGCSLAGLVIIVLIGYFIGRRRKQRGAGYRKL